MLEGILVIQGRSGLFRKLSLANGRLIVESLLDGKRSVAFAREQISALQDIQMYGENGEKPLGEILQAICDKENKKPIEFDIKKATNAQLAGYMEQVFPDYDKDRVYPSDIRKLLLWYNILLNAEITQFIENQENKK